MRLVFLLPFLLILSCKKEEERFSFHRGSTYHGSTHSSDQFDKHKSKRTTSWSHTCPSIVVDHSNLHDIFQNFKDNVLNPNSVAINQIIVNHKNLDFLCKLSQEYVDSFKKLFISLENLCDPGNDLSRYFNYCYVSSYHKSYYYDSNRNDYLELCGDFSFKYNQYYDVSESLVNHSKICKKNLRGSDGSSVAKSLKKLDPTERKQILAEFVFSSQPDASKTSQIKKLGLKGDEADFVSAAERYQKMVLATSKAPEMSLGHYLNGFYFYYLTKNSYRGTASFASQCQSAYRRTSVNVHPDKCGEACKGAFEVFGNGYEINQYLGICDARNSVERLNLVKDDKIQWNILKE